jgi:hypothetical protein
MAQYAFLLYSPAPADPMELPAEELAAHEAFGAVLDELGGTMLSAYALQPSTTATAIRGADIADGPFVDGDQVLAGFGVLEARDLDHAIQIAKANPATWRGGIEVRPLFAPPEE